MLCQVRCLSWTALPPRLPAFLCPPSSRQQEPPMGFLRRYLLAGHGSHGSLSCAKLTPSSAEGHPSPLTSRAGWKPYLFPPALHDGEQDIAWEPGSLGQQGVSKLQFSSNLLSFRGCGSDELLCFAFSSYCLYWRLCYTKNQWPNFSEAVTSHGTCVVQHCRKCSRWSLWWVLLTNFFLF